MQKVGWSISIVQPCVSPSANITSRNLLHVTSTPLCFAWCTVLYSAILCCTVLYCTVVYSATLYCIVLYSATLPHCHLFALFCQNCIHSTHCQLNNPEQGSAFRLESYNTTSMRYHLTHQTIFYSHNENFPWSINTKSTSNCTVTP